MLSKKERNLSKQTKGDKYFVLYNFSKLSYINVLSKRIHKHTLKAVIIFYLVTIKLKIIHQNLHDI